MLTTRMLKDQSSRLRDKAATLKKGILHERNRSKELIRAGQKAMMRARSNYDCNVDISIHELLAAFPDQGGWMTPPCKYMAIINDFCDAGTTFIEEYIDATKDGELLNWFVRLTPRGIIERDDVHCKSTKLLERKQVF